MGKAGWVYMDDFLDDLAMLDFVRLQVTPLVGRGLFSGKYSDCWSVQTLDPNFLQRAQGR